MGSRGPREYTYGEFTDFTRQFNQEGLLTAVAERAVSLPDDASEKPYRATPPWALAGNPSGTRKEFWWEREWRHVGDLRFTAKDVVVVFAPESEHGTLRDFLAKDPDYDEMLSKLVDVQWGLERMIATLAGVSDHGPFPQRPAGSPALSGNGALGIRRGVSVQSGWAGLQ